jgi:hypothetical protein
MSKQIKTLFTAGYILAVAFVLTRFYTNLAYDDPFITYRYAQNIASGVGFVYNAGERVLSTTTPLFSLLLSLISFVWADLPQAAVWLGALSLAAGAVFIWRLAEAWGTPEVCWAALLLYPAFPLVVSTLGSETPLSLALCIASFLLYTRKQYVWTAVVAALAVLTRPDGILVPAVLAVDYLLRVRRPIPWGAVGLFAAILLGWALFGWAYFGSPVPVTLAAKQYQGAMAISERFFGGFFSILRWYASWTYLLQAVLALIGGLALFGSGRLWLPFLAWTALYFTAYSLLGVSRYFWYYSPLIPGFIVLVGLGFRWLRVALSRMSYQRISWGSAMLAAAPLVLGLYGQAESLAAMHQQPDNRYQAYRAVGEWIDQNTAPTDRVGTLEVGIIGYYSKRAMIDFAGLIQPDVAAQFSEATTYEDAALYALERYHPDVLALHDRHFPRLEADLAAHSCLPVKHFPGKTYQYGADLVIYFCR